MPNSLNKTAKEKIRDRKTRKIIRDYKKGKISVEVARFRLKVLEEDGKVPSIESFFTEKLRKWSNAI